MSMLISPLWEARTASQSHIIISSHPHPHGQQEAQWLMRAKKHVKKLNNPIADVLIENACKATSSLETYLKKQLEAEKRLKNASKESI